MKTLKEFLEARMIATGDFKISASGRKVRRLIKVGDDAYSKEKDVDNDGDNDENDDKARKMRGESVEQVEEGWYEKPASAYRRKGDEIGGGSPTNFSPNSRASLAKNSKAPVAPVPDKKYIKGTPEHKAYKATKKPINGMPTNKMKEEVEHIEEATVKSQNYSWGTMKTVHHGKDFSIPLHPEHHKPIAALKHGESHSFKDETGNKWKATRDNDTVHFHGGSYGTQKTSVKHDTMKESVEITEDSEHLVHVSDGSKYDEKPHPKDVEHVMSGVKTHGGSFDGHSDKGAYFKFKSHDDAKNFKKHVDSCPNRSCSADLHESTEQVTEATDKQDARLMQLARLGLLDKSDIALFRVSMQTFKADKQLSIKQRTLLLTVYDELVNLVTGDDAIFSRTKIDLQREETEQLDEISKETLASYIPKAAKDARIHGQIASDFAARGKTARKPGSKQSWERLSQKYKEKAWKRDDGITKAVNKLTKEEAEQQAEGYYKDIDTNNKETERLNGSWKVETPWRKIKADTVTDKSGAKHGPMSRVRHLARLARAKSSK